MQWALVGDLGAAGAAVLLALLCMAVIYLLKAIAALLPKVNLGVVVVDFPKYFTAITNPVVSWLVGATNELWSDAEWWMRNISAAVSWLVNDIVSAFEHDATWLEHLFSTVIPQAGAHAISSATGYIDSEITTLHRDIASAVTTVEKAVDAETARALAKAETFASEISGDLTRMIAHDLTVSEKFATGVADKAFADAKGLIDALPALPRELVAGVDYVTPAALATVAAAVAAVTTEVERCAVTTCDGPNNLSGLLQNLLGFASLATFAAFLSDIIENPGTAVAKYGSEFQGIAEKITGAGTDIWSDIESVLSI